MNNRLIYSLMDLPKRMRRLRSLRLEVFAIASVVKIRLLHHRIDAFFASEVLKEKANIKAIIKLLSSNNENTLVSALTTLFYLSDDPLSHSCICYFS